MNCATNNPPESKFCSGCGQTLFEQCKQCGHSLRIGTAFCGNCGCNAKQAFETARDEMVGVLLKARELGESHDYDEAISKAESVREAPDYRFKDIADKADEMLGLLERRRQKYMAQVAKVVPAARAAFDAGKQDEVVRLLSSVPRKLLDDEVWSLAARARSSMGEKAQLVDQIRDSLQQKDYELAGGLVDRMLQLKPGDEKFTKLAGQIANELMKTVVKDFQAVDYESAERRLASVPLSGRNKDFRRLQALLNEVRWTQEHLRAPVFMSPSLVAISKRYCQLAPADRNAQAIYKRLSQSPTGVQPAPQGLFPRLERDISEIYRSPVDLLADLQSVDCSQVGSIVDHPMRFNAAIGAALQGIGKATYDFRLGGKDEGFALKKLLRRKKEEPVFAWGMDLGPSSIRIVRMQLEPGSEIPKLTEAELVSFDEPLSRATQEMKGSVVLREKLDELVERFPLREEPVWTLLASRNALGRFVEMPSLSDKQIRELVVNEVEHQFPVPAEQLEWNYWIADAAVEDNAPRYCSIVGVRKFVVEQQLQMLTEVGITPAGLQADPVALANLASFEFRDVIQCEEFTITPPGIAVVDVGVDATTLLVCTQGGYWYRTFDVGGDSFVVAIAKEMSITLKEAELVMHNIVAQPQLAPLYAAIDQPLGRINLRLKQLLASAKKELGDFSLKGVWCTGGATRLHGFVDLVFSDT